MYVLEMERYLKRFTSYWFHEETSSWIKSQLVVAMLEVTFERLQRTCATKSF